MVMRGNMPTTQMVPNTNRFYTLPHMHYSSTPHLFVFQGTDDADYECDTTDDSASSAAKSDGDGSRASSKEEPIYSSALDVDSMKQIKKQGDPTSRIIEKYDSPQNYSYRRSFQSHPNGQLKSPSEDPFIVTEDDVARIETFFKGHRTQIWVCRTMANLYQETNTPKNSAPSWQIRYTGVPLLLLDSGETKSRDKRMLQLIMAEKGTGFALWKDIIDNLTSYKIQEPHFHTFYLSSDHRQRLGLSFNDAKLAMDFHSILDNLTSDPANISLNGPGKKKKDKAKEKTGKYKPPKKTDISQPCNFNHITNVDPTDKGRFFSLQLFSRKSSAPTTNPVRPKSILETHSQGSLENHHRPNSEIINRTPIQV